MKAVTLIAIIAISLQVLGSLYFALLTYDIMEPNETIIQIVRPLTLLAELALLVFFIRLFQKQTKQ